MKYNKVVLKHHSDSENIKRRGKMKSKLIKKALSVVLAGAMVICLTAAAGVPTAVFAEESEGGKYVSDVLLRTARLRMRRRSG